MFHPLHQLNDTRDHVIIQFIILKTLLQYKKSFDNVSSKENYELKNFQTTKKVQNYHTCNDKKCSKYKITSINFLILDLLICFIVSRYFTIDLVALLSSSKSIILSALLSVGVLSSISLASATDSYITHTNNKVIIFKIKK